MTCFYKQALHPALADEDGTLPLIMHKKKAALTLVFSEDVSRQFCCDDAFIGVYPAGNFSGGSYIHQY